MMMMILSFTKCYWSLILWFLCSVKSAESLAMQERTKVALIDRDGVVNEDVGAPGVLCASQLTLTQGAGRALGKLRRNGWAVCLVTNQSCVGKGLIAEEDLVGSIHPRLQEMLLEEDNDAILDKILYCTSLRESNDHRMKPNPGMVEEAMEAFGWKDPNCSLAATSPTAACESVFLIGDALRDMEAAARGGVQTRILVQTGYGEGIMGGQAAPSENGRLKLVPDRESMRPTEPKATTNPVSVPDSVLPFWYAKNLYSAVDWILSARDEQPEEQT